MEKYIRIKEVLNKLPVSKSTWWSWVKSGKAPTPIKLSASVTVWRESEIKTFIESKKEQ